MKRQQRVVIPEGTFQRIDSYDRIMRDHNFIAQQAGNALNKEKMELVMGLDPDLAEDWKKGFVDVGIDWKTKELVVSPTIDPVKKAMQASDAIAKLKNGNTKKTDTIN